MAIHIALAKGRIHKVVMKYLAESGYDFPTYSEESRKLIFEDAKGQLKVTLVKSPDVAVYVERGAADVGIVGKDVLIEEAPGADVYEVMDLGIGRCRMAVAGIAGKKGFLSIEIVKRNMSTMVGIVSGALDVLNKYGVSIEHLPSGIDSFNVVVNKKDVEHNLYEILSEIKQAIAPDSIRVPEPIALIAVVGRNMNARVGSSAKLFGALAEANVNIRMISQGSSEIDIIVGVSQQDFSKAVQALYNTFTK